MVEGASKEVLIQNQSLALLDEGANDDQFERFFSAVRRQQRRGLDVRIVFRDPREFSVSGGTASLQKLLERAKDFGLDTTQMKVQRKCHTKGIIVDSREVMLGSQNLTNAGALYNRDASLRVRDEDVAKYFRTIFLFDWEVLATQAGEEEEMAALSPARLGEAPPPRNAADPPSKRSSACSEGGIGQDRSICDWEERTHMAMKRKRALITPAEKKKSFSQEDATFDGIYRKAASSRPPR